MDRQLGFLAAFASILMFPCAQATPPPPPALHIPIVEVRVWFDNLTLAPGASKTWFEDDVPQDRVRYFTAVPIGVTAIDAPFVDFDQTIAVTDIFYILKGEHHASDGSGGQRTLQVNVTVTNRDREHPATFRIYKGEFKSSD